MHGREIYIRILLPICLAKTFFMRLRISQDTSDSDLLLIPWPARNLMEYEFLPKLCPNPLDSTRRDFFKRIKIRNVNSRETSEVKYIEPRDLAAK